MAEEQAILTTTRLLLRPFTLADAPEVQRLAGDEAIASTTLTIPHPFTTGLAEDWISTLSERFEWGQLVVFAITLAANDRLIGSIGLSINHWHGHGELDYWIGKPFWGQGYATEAARAIIRYGFESLALHRVQAYILKRNPASGRVLQKLGLRYEGCMREHVKKWGIYEDVEIYGLLESEREQVDQL